MKKQIAVIFTIGGLVLSPLVSQAICPSCSGDKYERQSSVKKQTLPEIEVYTNTGVNIVSRTYVAQASKDEQVYLYMISLPMESSSYEKQSFAVIRRSNDNSISFYRLVSLENNSFQWYHMYTNSQGVLIDTNHIVFTSMFLTTAQNNQIKLIKNNKSNCGEDIGNIVFQEVDPHKYGRWVPLPRNMSVYEDPQNKSYVVENVYSGKTYNNTGDYFITKNTLENYISIVRPKVNSAFTATGYDISLEADSVMLVFNPRQTKSRWGSRWKAPDHKYEVLFTEVKGNDCSFGTSSQKGD